MDLADSSPAAHRLPHGTPCNTAEKLHAAKLDCVAMVTCVGLVVHGGSCIGRRSLELRHCEAAEGYETHVNTPSRMPTGTETGDEVARFFAIGDWNFDHEGWGNYVPDWVGNRVLCTSLCQGKVADLMRAEAAAHPGEYKFVANAGDNFYPFGVPSATDWQWEERWGKPYHGLPKMPWYSTQGNHDLAQTNRACACGWDLQRCAQIQKHGGMHHNQTWYMPTANFWVKPIEGVNLEVLVLDTNHLDSGRICPWNACNRKDCWEGESTNGPDSCTVRQCQSILEGRTREALTMLRERVEANVGGNLIIVTHYPINYIHGGGVKGERVDSGEWMRLLRRTDLKITYLGAHVHVTEKHASSIAPHEEYVVGGGGGWSCDGQQGIVVGDVLIATGEVFNTYSIRASRRCRGASAAGTTRTRRPTIDAPPRGGAAREALCVPYPGRRGLGAGPLDSYRRESCAAVRNEVGDGCALKFRSHGVRTAYILYTSIIYKPYRLNKIKSIRFRLRRDCACV